MTRQAALTVLEALVRSGMPVSRRTREHLARVIGPLSEGERDRLRASAAGAQMRVELARQREQRLAFVTSMTTKEKR